MRRVSAVVLVLLALSILTAADTPQQLTAAEAAKHVGEYAKVCGEVVSTKYASSSRGQPTFLNLDKPYPDHIFTIVIWGDNRSKFDQPEVKYKDKQVCVTGTIETYSGKPQIIARSPEQIKIMQQRKRV
jgi:DNA/RNA endonuclease YhcR with UshA esterase domain